MIMDFELEILTAVNIGSGEVLSQFSDYVYDNGFVYYLDHDSLLRELTRKPNSEEMIDEFVMIVQNQAKGSFKDRFKLKGFLEKAGLDYKKYALRKIPVTDEVKEQIQLHIKSGSQPYIPGSSLKGAIRTAIISFLFGGSEERLKNKRNYIGEDLFGSYGQDVLKYLVVSDTMPFQEKDLGIATFHKLNLESKKTSIPVIKEVISRGSVSTFSIKTKAKKGEVKEQFTFLQEGKEDSLLGIINEYSRKNIEIELEQLQKYRGDEIKDIEEFYSSLFQVVTKAYSTKEAYLRIGSGKTFYDNTIAQKLSKDFLQQVITKNFKKANIKYFPKTRTVIREGLYQRVPGWIRISKI
jgi:CRISPR/Cas system CSM-associated protein Csm5 (group 7 of RAMP superfamily)